VDTDRDRRLDSGDVDVSELKRFWWARYDIKPTGMGFRLYFEYGIGYQQTEDIWLPRDCLGITLEVLA